MLVIVRSCRPISESEKTHHCYCCHELALASFHCMCVDQASSLWTEQKQKHNFEVFHFAKSFAILAIVRIYCKLVFG